MNRSPRSVLGIAELPDRVRQLAPGRLYAVASDQPLLRAHLAAQSLRAAVDAGVPALLVAPANARIDSAAPRLPRDAGFRSVSATGLLVHARRGIQPMLDRLDQWLPLPGSLLVIDGAEAFFGLGTANAAEANADAWRAWAADRGHTVLALFDAVTGSEPFMDPESIAASFGGFAVLSAGNGQALLTMRHWTQLRPSDSRSSWPVRLDARAGLVVQQPSRQTSDDAPALVATRRAAADFDAAASGWQVVDGWSAAVQAARTLQRGVVVVHFHRPQDFKTLARTVAAIRSRAARSPAVIVRETGARLRIAQQAVLLRLGAGLLAARETDAMRLRLAAESFASAGGLLRGAETDVERVLADAEVMCADGPCVPRAFREQVERMVSDGGGIQHALLRLEAAGDDLGRLATIGARRARDALLCGHDGAVWLFLLGCPADRVDAVLARVFGARFERLFVRRALYDRPGSMRAALAALPAGDGASTSAPAAATSSAGR